MTVKFWMPFAADKRVAYAEKRLKSMGYLPCDCAQQADFVLLGVNPDKVLLTQACPVFAGNVTAPGVTDYTRDECFALQNACLTAESALSLAVSESDGSLMNACVLIVGYGRIGKALHRYLQPFTRHVTVCARKEEARVLAKAYGAKAITFDALNKALPYDYIFNTVPHPVFGETQLKNIRKDSLLMDLASLPGGVDVHLAKYYGVPLTVARGLPGKYTPAAAGKVLAQTVDRLYKEMRK